MGIYCLRYEPEVEPWSVTLKDECVTDTFIHIMSKDNKSVEKFLKVTTRRELAAILSVEYKTLMYYLFVLDEDLKYHEFVITKRKGGERKITAPNSGIKYIQRNLNKYLLEIYPVKSSTHGYVKNKSIKTNVSMRSGTL